MYYKLLNYNAALLLNVSVSTIYNNTLHSHIIQPIHLKDVPTGT